MNRIHRLYAALGFCLIFLDSIVSRAASTSAEAAPPLPWWSSPVQGLEEGAGATIVAVVGAWFFTARLTAQWDARKKRSEFDIALARDFYRLVGSFKALAREGSALGPRPQGAGALEWQKWHTDLVQRAIASEFEMEAVLLAIVSEESGDELFFRGSRKRMLQASGLLRVAYRNLREQIEEGKMGPPNFSSPLFWLTNRIQGELSRLVFARAARELRSPTSEAPPANAADYLGLISYRTADLEYAAGRIAPYVADFIQKRANSRLIQRTKNVQTLFKGGSFTVNTSAGGLTNPLPASNTIVILMLDQKKNFQELEAEAVRILNDHASLTHVLFIGDHIITRDIVTEPKQDGEQGIYIKSGNNSSEFFDSIRTLPQDLPYKPGITLPVFGVRILEWTIDAQTSLARRKMADADILPITPP